MMSRDTEEEFDSQLAVAQQDDQARKSIHTFQTTGDLKETEEVAVPNDTQERFDCYAIWKYLMVIFRETNHRNYAKEAALLLISYNFTSSETTAAQLLTICFVNTKGCEDCNMPCNLHLEHLNRRLKGTISGMESNVQPSSIKRASRAIGVVDEIC